MFLRLAATADVLVENFRPGTLERWGLGPESCSSSTPAWCSSRITGFGQTGPYAARAGFGTLAEAMSGFAHLTGQPDGPPTLPAFGLADSICGIAASSAISMALLRPRDATAEAARSSTSSLLEPIMTAVGPGPTVYQQTGVVGTRHGNRSTNNAPRNTYRTSDGHWVAISTSAQAIAERVLRLVGHPEVIDEPWFAAGDTRAAARRPARRVRRRLDRRAHPRRGGAPRSPRPAPPIAPIYSAQDLVEDEHVRATEMLTEVDDPALGDGAPAQRDVADVGDARRGSGSPARRSAPTPTTSSPSSASTRRRRPARPESSLTRCPSTRPSDIRLTADPTTDPARCSTPSPAACASSTWAAG